MPVDETARNGFWNPCPHPIDQQIPSPDGTGSTLCGKCGAEQHPLSIEDFIHAAQAVKGGPMPELGVDMSSLEDEGGSNG